MSVTDQKKVLFFLISPRTGLSNIQQYMTYIRPKKLF